MLDRQDIDQQEGFQGFPSVLTHVSKFLIQIHRCVHSHVRSPSASAATLAVFDELNGTSISMETRRSSGTLELSSTIDSRDALTGANKPPL